MIDFLILTFKLFLIEIVEVEVASVLFRVPMLGTKSVITATLDSSQANFLLAVPASGLVLLMMSFISFLPRWASMVASIPRQQL